VFEAITESLQGVFRKLGLRGRLSEKNITEGLREVRTALLSADVNYKVVKDFIARVKEKALGQDVIKSVRPEQQIVKIVYDELVELMGPTDTSITGGTAALYKGPAAPAVIMMVGLQGGGKTTSCGKLAQFLRQKRGHHPLLVAADMQRPAAVEQLRVLGEQLGIPVYSQEQGKPPDICARALEHAASSGNDIVILDTAGRLHIDETLMAELREIQKRTKPQEIFFIADAMTGQDAVNSAKEFNSQLEITGVVLTKMDGDARGGAALSVRAVTGKPIKFVGVGEKLDNLEEFHPDRVASRILGMGDVVSLVEKAQETITEEEALKMQEKLLKQKFTLGDFMTQLQQLKRMGGIKDLLGMIPGLGSKIKGADIDDREIFKIEALIQSMTPEERNFPEVIDGSRRLRVARGAGRSVHDVNELLKQFKQMQKMVGDFKKRGFFGKLKAMKNMPDIGELTGVTAQADKPGETSKAKRLRLREERKRQKKHKKKGRKRR
jgi:signal recognition particle subunit SRP54